MRILPLFIALFLLTQCTVERRVHRSGWHVEWKKMHFRKNFEKNSKTKNSLEFLQIDRIESQQLSAIEVNKVTHVLVDSSVLPLEQITEPDAAAQNVSSKGDFLGKQIHLEDSTYFDKVKRETAEKSNNNKTNSVFLFVFVFIIALLLLTVVVYHSLGGAALSGPFITLALVYVSFALLIAALATLVIFLIYKKSTSPKKVAQKITPRSDEADGSETSNGHHSEMEENESEQVPTKQSEEQSRKFIPWLFGGIAAIFVVGYLLLSK